MPAGIVTWLVLVAVDPINLIALGAEVGEAVGVATIPFCTSTLIALDAIGVPELSKPCAEMVWLPFPTVLEFHVNMAGGGGAKKISSIYMFAHPTAAGFAPPI